MIPLRNRRLAKTLGARLALSACAALALVAVTTTPSEHHAATNSSRAAHLGSGVKLVEEDIPEVDIIGTPDGSWSVPFQWFTYTGDSSMVTVTIQANRPSPPTCTFNTLNNNNLQQMIIANEGSQPHVYTDTQGHPSVGVGFNLDRADAAKTLRSVGANYNNVRSGAANLNPTQINQLLGADIAAASSRARHYFTTFNSLNAGQQAALVDMAFNLSNKLSQFKNMIADVNAGNYSAASTAALQSLWAAQVGARSVRDADNLVACH